jgi:hypothetical protein
MPGIIGPTWGEVGSSDFNIDNLPSSTSERVDPIATTRLLARSIGNAQAELGTVDDYGRPTSAPEPSVDPAALNAKWGIDGSTPAASLKFTTPIPESVAQDMNAAKRDEIARTSAQQRAPGGVISALTDFGYGSLDPVGIAAAAMPVFGEARIATTLGNLGIDLGEGIAGKVATRAITGAADATAANVPLVAATYGMSQQEHADYSMTDAAQQLAYGALLGGVLHPLIGGASDALHEMMGKTPAVQALDADPQARSATMQGGVSAAMEDRPFDAAPFADLAQARAEREDLWFRLSQDSEDLQSEISGIQDTAPVDPATSARLDAIQTELQDPATTADRRAALGQEASMLTEGAQPTPAADDLYAARSQSQREGLQAALERNRQQIADIEQNIYGSDMMRRARGEPSPEDAAMGRQVDAAAKLPPTPADGVPPDIEAQIAKLEADIQRTRTGGQAVPQGEVGGTDEPGSVPASRSTFLDNKWLREAGASEGGYDMGQGGAALSHEVQTALGNGERVTLVTDGGAKEVTITSVDRGMMKDAQGQRWGTMSLAADATDKEGVRIEHVPRLDPEHEAAFKEIASAEQASQSRANAFLQAGACVARGMI